MTYTERYAALQQDAIVKNFLRTLRATYGDKVQQVLALDYFRYNRPDYTAFVVAGISHNEADTLGKKLYPGYNELDASNELFPIYIIPGKEVLKLRDEVDITTMEA